MRMSDDKKKPGMEEEVDARTEYMSVFVLKALRLKPDKWHKMLQGEEKQQLQKFFETPEIQMITFHINNAGLPQPYFGYSATSRSKVVYFVRNISQVITQDNVRLTLLVGELSNETIDELTILTEEIFTPLLCNPMNHWSWPDVVIDDIKKQVYCFKNVLYQIRGDLNSQVMLPMPAGVEKIDQAEREIHESNGETMDVYLKTNIEGVVIQWANQINNVLKEDSSVVFRKAQFPMPMADIRFWASRLKNLEGIYSQLRDHRVKKMARYLEMTDSVYLQCFRSMLTNLVAGVVEARDIVLYQKPLIYHFETFENTVFTDSKSLIRPMLHCIGLLWGNSQYYCTTDKITVLIQEVCNMMIEKCTSSCDPSAIFFGEAAEQVGKINEVISILEYFVRTYEMNRSKVPTFFPPDMTPIMWSFDFEKVFFRFVEFMKRLKMVREMLQTTVEMLKLEKVEYSGIRGKILV